MNRYIQPDWNPLVEGYARRYSVLPGEQVEMCCSSLSSRPVTVEVARVGARRDSVWNADVVIREQAVPTDAYMYGCGWDTSFVIPTGTDWRSGFYEVVFRADGAEPGDEDERVSRAFFALRSRRPCADGIIVALATNTYQAYNMWGGRNFYTGAHAVSFERPMDRGFIHRVDEPYDGRVAAVAPEGDPEHTQLLAYLDRTKYPMWCASSSFHNWERRFIRWAEGAGFTVDVCTNADVEADETLDGYRLLCSVGHDEYWSWAQRDVVDSFVQRGGNLAVLSGNTSFWQVRLEDDGRTLIGYKGAARHDPVVGTDDYRRMTGAWSTPVIDRPENETIGLSFTRGGYVRVGRGVPRSSGAYTVYRPEHWLFEGAGLHYGDSLGLGSYVVGYETDGCAFTMERGVPVATHEDRSPEGIEILATSPARLLSQNETVSEIPKAIWGDPNGPGDLEGVAAMLFGSAAPEHTARIAHGNAMIACFRRGAGTVVNVGSTDWCYGLDADPQIRRVTENAVRRLSSSAPAPAP